MNYKKYRICICLAVIVIVLGSIAFLLCNSKQTEEKADGMLVKNEETMDEKVINEEKSNGKIINEVIPNKEIMDEKA